MSSSMSLKIMNSMDNICLGIVGGGTYEKIQWQMKDSIKYFKYIFAECGAVVYINGQLNQEKNMLDYCDRNMLNIILKKALYEISMMPIIYHGHQLDFRKGLVYISPPGMQSSKYERNFFIDLDSKLNLRSGLLNQLIAMDIDGKFDITYGGAVGIAVSPKGWNKSQVLDSDIAELINDEIYYFGDRTEPDGNDYPLYSHPMVKGFSVKDYNYTITKLKDIFLSNNQPTCDNS